ncbi:UNVERIFIED_CONTAM: hypothetical protein Slati_4277900 [Sesamum latifolium]|uniref:Uncharacterized protein n=1 Tax=Sesamum latifolium TaxID=2727402 RepID=A0AAW2TDI2_9LAMI
MVEWRKHKVVDASTEDIHALQVVQRVPLAAVSRASEGFLGTTEPDNPPHNGTFMDISCGKLFPGLLEIMQQMIASSV